MKIELTVKEFKIIRRYRKHLWNIAKISEKPREVLNRIIVECGEEIDMIERDLMAERKGIFPSLIKEI